jgi:RNA polymerase sigma-70 factor (ECF subfamily)
MVDQQSLVEQAQRGDHDAFATLARAAVLRLGPAARLILRDPELARDAVQDAFISAWRDLPGLRDPARFDAWLYRLTVNSCLALARRKRRRPVEIDVGNVQLTARGDFAGDVAVRDQLDRALRQLQPDRRALVVMHLYLGMPLPEVAIQLRIPVGTAKSRLNRSLAVLRVVVADDPEPRGRRIQEEGQPA